MKTTMTVCENRFEVVCGMATRDEMIEIIKEFHRWLLTKEEPRDVDYMSALGPCGK